MTLIDIVGSITGGIGASVSRRYISSSISGNSDALGDISYTLVGEVAISQRGGAGAYAWAQAQQPIEVYIGEMSVVIVGEAKVVGALITYRHMAAVIPCRTVVAGTLSAYNDAFVVSRNRGVAVGKATSVIDYELARREDEVFLLTA